MLLLELDWVCFVYCCMLVGFLVGLVDVDIVVFALIGSWAADWGCLGFRLLCLLAVLIVVFKLGVYLFRLVLLTWNCWLL